MMMLTATICILTGAVLGLRFNIKMLAHGTLAIIVLSAGGGIFGSASLGFILADGIVAIIALQVGYCLTLLLSAMGHMRQIATPSRETTNEAKAFDHPNRDRAHLPR